MPLSLCRFPVQLEPALPARLVRLDDLLAPAGSGDEGTQGEGHPNQSGTTGDCGCQQTAESLHDALPILLAGGTLELGGTFTPFQGLVCPKRLPAKPPPRSRIYTCPMHPEFSASPDIPPNSTRRPPPPS